MHYVDVSPESNPKWEAVDEILKEIKTNNGGMPQTVVIFVEDWETCKQLKNVNTAFTVITITFEIVRGAYID